MRYIHPPVAFAPLVSSRSLISCARLLSLSLCVLGLARSGVSQAQDPLDSSKVLNLTTFASFSPLPSSGALDLEHAKDGTGRVFVSTNEGKVLAYSSTGVALGVFLDLAAPGVVPDFDSMLQYSIDGLSCIAFHPDYARPGTGGEGKFYTTYQSNVPGLRVPDYSGAGLPTRPGIVLAQYAITEWTVDPSNLARIDPNSRREVIRFESSGPKTVVHSVGGLSFDPFAQPGDADYGNLYIPMGDMNDTSTVPNWQHVQDRDNPFGKILRINPLANGAAPYSVPASNPFADGGSVLDPDGNTEEIYAWGFRNPHTMSFAQDRNGISRLIVFDIGAADYEEINVVDRGDNHGWTRFDGAVPGNPATALNMAAGAILEFPAAVYDHTIPNLPGTPPVAGLAAITGGFVVSDPNDPTFENELIFGDLPRGTFFHVDFDELLAADGADQQARTFVMSVSVDGGVPGRWTTGRGTRVSVWTRLVVCSW